VSDVVDARGYSCPQPVLMTLDRIRRGPATELVVLVDAEVSMENVSRAAASKGWKVAEVREEGLGYRLDLREGNEA